MFFQNVGQGAAVNIVVFGAVNIDVGAFGTIVATAQTGKLDLGFQTVFFQKLLDDLQVFGIASGKTGASHTNFYLRRHFSLNHVEIIFPKYISPFIKTQQQYFIRKNADICLLLRQSEIIMVKNVNERCDSE